MIKFNLVNTKTNERVTQYNVFERRVREKQSFLEWRLAFMFSEEDLKEGLKELRESNNVKLQ